MDIGRRSVLKGLGVAAGAATVGATGLAMGQDDAGAPEIEWTRNYSGGEREYEVTLRHLVQTDDHGFALAGVGAPITETGAEDEQFALFKAGADGEKQWQTFEDDDSDETTDPATNAVVQTGDGGFALVGAVDDPSERQTDTRSGSIAVAIKFDDSGAREWLESIDTFDGEKEGRTDESRASFDAVAPAGEDGSVVAGGVTESDAWVVQFGADGSVEWETIWTDEGDDEYDIARVDEMYTRDDDGYTLFTTQGAGERTHRFAVHLDGQGTVRDRTELRVDDEATPYNRVFTRTPDGGYGYTGRDRDRENVVLGKLNAAGRRQWRREFDGPYEGTDWGFDVVATSDDGLAVSGQMREAYSGETVPAIVKTTAGGDEQWRRLFDDLPGSEADPFIETADSGYAFLTGRNLLVKLTPDDVPESGGEGGDDGTPDEGPDSPGDGADGDPDTPAGTATPEEGSGTPAAGTGDDPATPGTGTDRDDCDI